MPEQHRVATIKKETTKIAAEDLKKYEKALDQVGARDWDRIRKETFCS